MKRQRMSLGGLLAVFLLAIFGHVQAARADHVLVYFDLSESVDDTLRAGMRQDFAKLTREVFRRGDTIVILPLGVSTHSFTPVGNVTIPKKDRKRSEYDNQQELDNAISKLKSAVANLHNTKRPETETFILGAFVSANDYFSQEKIPPEQRKIYIFSDMIEQSRASKIDMSRSIPEHPPAGLGLPNNLDGEVNCIGVKIDAKRQDTLRRFWENAVKSTGSTLKVYRQRL